MEKIVVQNLRSPGTPVQVPSESPLPSESPPRALPRAVSSTIRRRRGVPCPSSSEAHTFFSSATRIDADNDAVTVPLHVPQHVLLHQGCSTTPERSLGRQPRRALSTGRPRPGAATAGRTVGAETVTRRARRLT